MSNYVSDNNGNLYDPATGNFVGIIDPTGREQLIPTTSFDPVTGGIGILGPDGKQVAGTASPYAFTTRALDETDNGQTRICASAQTATVNASMPVGFGVAFKGAISFTAGAGVTIDDSLRTSGAAKPWCALVQTGVDTYDVVGTKA